MNQELINIMDEFFSTTQYQGEIGDWNTIDETYEDPDEEIEEFSTPTIIRRYGGPGSGHHGHAGRPGMVGGSGAGGGVSRLKNIFGDKFHIEDMDAAIVQQHMADLDKFSDSTLKSLASAGVSIYIGDKTFVELDDNQGLRGVTPRGWPRGSTWDKVPGGYNVDTKTVSIGKGDHGCASLLGHEIGHAIYRETIRKDPVKQKMLIRLHESHNDSFGLYYKQPGHAGIDEMIAESIACNVKYGKVVTHAGFSNSEAFAKDMTIQLESWGVVG